MKQTITCPACKTKWQDEYPSVGDSIDCPNEDCDNAMYGTYDRMGYYTTEWIDEGG